MADTFKVLIAEDHSITGWGLALLLSGMPDIEVPDHVTDGIQLDLVLRQRDIDLLLLDLVLPGMNGLDVLAAHKQRSFSVLVFSGQMVEQDFQRAYDLGANALVSKSDEPDVLIDALNAIRAGKRFLSPQVFELIGRQC